MRAGSRESPGRSVHGFDHSSPQFLERDAPDTGSQPDEIGTWRHPRRRLERNRPQPTPVTVAVDGGSQPPRGGVSEPPGPVARRRRLVVYCHHSRPGTAARRPQHLEGLTATHPPDSDVISSPRPPALGWGLRPGERNVRRRGERGHGAAAPSRSPGRPASTFGGETHAFAHACGCSVGTFFSSRLSCVVCARLREHRNELGRARTDVTSRPAENTPKPAVDQSHGRYPGRDLPASRDVGSRWAQPLRVTTLTR